MILKAKHHFFIYPFFQHFAVWMIRRDFKPVKLIGRYQDKHLPVLMISNHISWWDGFWAEYVNLKTFRRKFHFMMLEEQLQKHWYFRYTGGFSVNKKSKSLVESIRYAAEVLSDKENMVLLFPQGKIETMHNQDLLFEKGIDHILKHREDKVQIIFLVNLVDFFSSPKPGVYFYIREYDSGALDTVSIQNSYNVFYRECVEQQKQILS